jgi:predicted SAM-dependent methyltransferase
LGKAKPTRVQVASGFYPTQGYFHIDVDPVNTAQVDLISDAKNLTLDPDSVDEVLIVHLLEHLRDWEIYRVLFEAWKVLKERGMVEVHVPDFDVAVRMFKERGRSLPLLTRATKMLLGTNDPHINLFDFERLKGFLESVGFHDVRTLETVDVYDEIAELSLGTPHRVSLCLCATKGRLPGRK